MRIALMAAAVALSAARGDSRPALVNKGTGPSGVLNPLDEWHSVPLGGGMGLLHAGRDRRRRELASLEQQTPLLVAAESKGGNAMQQRQAIMATIWSFVATAAFAFGFVLPYKGKKATLDFITGFLVEKSLSVDNLFVFLMLFEYFRVPDEYTERVLRWGIMSALVLRGVMIAIGVAAVQRFRPVLLGFALILIVSAYKMLQPEGDEESLQDNAVMKIARWCVKATDEYDGDKFFTKIDGVRRATPMFVVLICIELSDVLFAVDSIPAVVGITQDAFIVYSSNIFALMALRSLYLILSKSVQQLIYLRHAVATILGFVGLKSARAARPILARRAGYPTHPAPAASDAHLDSRASGLRGSGTRVLPRTRLLRGVAWCDHCAARCGYDRLAAQKSASGDEWRQGAAQGLSGCYQVGQRGLIAATTRLHGAAGGWGWCIRRRARPARTMYWRVRARMRARLQSCTAAREARAQHGAASWWLIWWAGEAGVYTGTRNVSRCVGAM